MHTNANDPNLNLKILKSNKFNEIYLLYINNGNWSPLNWNTDGKCTDDISCYIWIAFNGIQKESILKSIDKKIDNGNGKSAGNFRWGDATPSPLYYPAFLKYAPKV